ncbi:50S ribosomal protein L11 methyltransferase [Woodsholea maritima]|uniref:50S ribosomal protein L11 methyltransferase n=1 Tax=Woodsholea maritima TaxID=240237 RepID=UPI0012E9B580|nr:50S ribosomal protein L11 methyltransferase [Woodsholea maritima]
MSTLWRWQALGPYAALKAISDRLDQDDEPIWLSSSVFGEDTPDEGRLDVLFGDMPDEDAFCAHIGLNAASTKGLDITLQPLPEEDWVRLSLAGLPPVQAGRFVLFGAHDRENLPQGKLPIEIEAGPAFGTGHHGTTKGCLIAADELEQTGFTPSRILDLGAGSGALAIAAAFLWPKAHTILASDIDPIAVDETIENATKNGVEARIGAFEADGFNHPQLETGEFDLIFANILAGPLEILAEQLAGALAHDGVAILSGLLEHQIDTVSSAYARTGLHVRSQTLIEGWAILTLDRRAA